MKKQSGSEHPDVYCCPISGDLMRDAVSVIVNGNLQTYSKKALDVWLSQHTTDPNTRVEIGKNPQIAPNLAMRSAIEDYLKPNSAAVVQELPAPAVALVPAQLPPEHTPYTALELYDFKKDSKRLQVALKDEKCAIKFTIDQLLKFSRDNSESATFMLIYPHLYNRLSKSEIIQIIKAHPRKNLADLIQNHFTHTDILMMIENGDFDCFSGEVEMRRLKALLASDDLWPQFKEVHWKTIFTSTICQELLESRDDKMSLMHQFANPVLEIFYKAISETQHKWLSTNLKTFLADKSLCDQLNPSCFYQDSENYTPYYLGLLVHTKHVLDRFSDAVKLSIFQKIAAQDKEAAVHLCSVIDRRQFQASHLCTYFQIFPGADFENEEEMNLLKQLSINDKVNLAAVNKRCFILFYFGDNLLQNINPQQLELLLDKHRAFFAKEDITIVGKHLIDALAQEIRDKINNLPSGSFKRQVEIASLVQTGGELTAYILVRDGYWTQTPKPLISLNALLKHPMANAEAEKLNLSRHMQGNNNNDGPDYSGRSFK